MGFLKPKWGKIFFNAKGGQGDKLSVMHSDKIVKTDAVQVKVAHREILYIAMDNTKVESQWTQSQVSILAV